MFLVTKDNNSQTRIEPKEKYMEYLLRLLLEV